MKKGFWTVLEECVGQRIEGSNEVRVFPLDTIKKCLHMHTEWGAPLPGFWLDLVLDEQQRPKDFKWKVEQRGNELRFIPKL